ncbi:MAG: hypothetical protein M3O50_09910 [Myxococcota bacterium]|nr:hypothetical protein [Myxococcota bacterium]
MLFNRPMLFNRMILSQCASLAASCAALLLPIAACSSDTTSAAPDGGLDGTSGSGSGSSSGSTGEAGAEAGADAARDAAAPEASSDAPSTCASPGAPTAGPKDAHCSLPDGGSSMQSTSQASCTPDVGAPAGDDGGGCAYGSTMFGSESDDDDCKYHVKWTSTPICAGSGVVVTAVVTHKTADGSPGQPLTGASAEIEAFTTSPGDWDAATFCDTMSTHPSPSGLAPLAENPPGTYTGSVVFDQPGQWTMRFHFFHQCTDVLPDSPHGHAAYHIAVP